MAEGVTFLLDLGILAVSALVLSILFARFKISAVSAQILAGMLVGPSVLSLVKDTTILNEISSVGIVLLLFIIGLELDPVELRRLAKEVALLTVLETGIAFAFGLLASYILGLSPLESIIFAMAGSITSTAIVGKIFLERRMLQTNESRFLIGLLIFEDMAAVVFLILLSSISSSTSNLPVGPLTPSAAANGIIGITEAVLGGLALLVLGYVVARYLAPSVINYLSSYEEEFEEIPFLFALGLGFLFGVLAAYLGYSPGIGAFIIGLSVRGKHSKFLSQKIEPIKDLFLVLFFVSMGSLINPVPALAIGLPAIVALLLLIAGKFFGGFLIGKRLRSLHKLSTNKVQSKGDASPSTFGAWLVPRGEFSLIMGQLGLTLGLVDGQTLFSLVGLGVLVTSIVGSILQKFAEPKKAPSDFPFKSMQDD